MHLDVKVKATVLGAAFLVVSIDLITYQPRTQGLTVSPLPATRPTLVAGSRDKTLGTRLITYLSIIYQVTCSLVS